VKKAKKKEKKRREQVKDQNKCTQEKNVGVI
jgi:hypothetical protein